MKYFDLAKYEIKFCQGCEYCDFNGKCIITNDGVEKLLDEIRNSDGIVIGSPVYISGVTGLLKAFFDRAHVLSIEQRLADKYGFAVSTYELGYGDAAIKAINCFFSRLWGFARRKVPVKIGL